VDEINIDLDKLTEVEEYKTILLLYDEAVAFLERQKWCNKVIKGWHEKDLSIYEKLGVFLFQIEPSDESTDIYVWVIQGDIPTVYVDQSVTEGGEALKIYCDLMDEWADNVLQGRTLEDCYPVDAEPTADNARLLKKRIAFIRKELLMQND